MMRAWPNLENAGSSSDINTGRAFLIVRGNEELWEGSKPAYRTGEARGTWSQLTADTPDG
jgi:hypothetical protein